MAFIGALDQGTTSSRFIIFDDGGSIIAQSQKEHQQYLPVPGWVEHNAAEIWQTVQEVIASALANAHMTGADLAAIGITNQRETIVAWDSITSEPLHHALVWQDVRTEEVLKQFPAERSATITSKTGLPLSPYFAGSKLQWLLTHCPDIQSAASAGRLKVGTIDSWLIWKLTGGVHKTDVTNASRTLLMNLESLTWDEELLALFGVAEEILPAIVSSSEIFGYTSVDGILGARVPIAGVLGDQQAAMVGQLCFEPGDTKCTYGTGNFALVNTGTQIVRSEHGLLTTVCFKFGDQPARFALEGSVAVTGSAVQWLRDQLGIISHSSEVEDLARSVPDCAGVYFVPAFSGLFAPYWRSDARGVIVGLTRAATKAHIARATLEAIAYQTRDVINLMARETGKVLSVLRVDGGITQNELCMQMQADILQMEISRPVVSETTALGAAYAAGLAVGVWKSVDELRSQWKEAKRWSPVPGSQLATSGFENWKRAIERTLNWV